MRRGAAVTVVLMLVLSGLPVGLAQTRTQVGAISGQAMDAGGRPLINQRVELVQGGRVVQTTVTGLRGEWSFANVAPGEYVVRLVINDQVTGIRVFLAAGQTITDAVIVAPSAAAPSAAFLAALPLLASIAIVAGIAAAVVTVIVVTAS